MVNNINTTLTEPLSYTYAHTVCVCGSALITEEIHLQVSVSSCIVPLILCQMAHVQCSPYSV